MKPDVWRASGHAAGFADPLVDCHISKERFRADKAPRPEVGAELPLTCADKGQAKTYHGIILERFGVDLKREGTVLHGLKVIDQHTVGFFADGADEAEKTFPFRGYVSPCIGSPFLSDERQFNLMFRTALGAVDPGRDAAVVVAELTAADDFVAAAKEKYARALKKTPNAAISKAIGRIDSGDIPPLINAASWCRRLLNKKPAPRWRICAQKPRRRCLCSLKMF